MIQAVKHAAMVAATALALTTPTADATWSIVFADQETGEVAVGTVTCLTNFDLLTIVPVVAVGKGAGAVQASGDLNGQRRPLIFNALRSGMSAQEALDAVVTVVGHQTRQYGVVDVNGGAVTFSGIGTMAWTGGRTGSFGTTHYAIQGNLLTGECVIDAIEQAITTTDGDLPAKLMAGMRAAADNGGDARCSCGVCTCPDGIPFKSGHIGGVIVARAGNADDDACDRFGCADGDYFMRLNVPRQPSSAPDPVDQLETLFDDFRAELVGKTDAIQSTIAVEADNRLIIELRDWQGEPIVDPIDLSIRHVPWSTQSSRPGTPSNLGNGRFEVPLETSGVPGIDRYRITANDGGRPVTLMPDVTIEYSAPGDCLADWNGDGLVSFTDIAEFLDSYTLDAGDIDANGTTNILDLLLFVSQYMRGCGE